MSHDLELQNAVRAELRRKPGVTEAHLRVTADQGVFSLKRHADMVGEAHKAQQREDDEIARTALDRLAWRDVDPGYNVVVTVQKGRIILTGHVAWPFQKDAAEEDVRRLPGVVGLDNRITITPNGAGT